MRPTLEKEVRDILFQGFCKEVVLWSKLSHPNILKLFGAFGDMEKGPLTTVSEWVAGGDIMEYIKHNPVNRLELVRNFPSSALEISPSEPKRQLHGAAQGLKYLHDEGIIHGDPAGVRLPSPSFCYRV